MSIFNPKDLRPVIIVAGFFFIVGVATVLIALYGAVTGTNPVCN